MTISNLIDIIFIKTIARVAELVDAQDLGSCTHKVWGFESPFSHQEGGFINARRRARHKES